MNGRTRIGKSISHPDGPVGPRLAAFSLPELLIALAISALVASGVAMMLYSTAYGTSSQRQMRSLMVANEMVSSRVNAALRASKMVLARGDGYLVLWMADTKVNEVPDLSELRRIERDPATNEFYSYKAPADLAEADDQQYDLATTDFDAATEAVKGSAVFPGQLWGTDVTGWATAVAGADLQELCYVGYQVTTTLEDVSATKIGGAALRNH